MTRAGNPHEINEKIIHCHTPRFFIAYLLVGSQHYGWLYYKYSTICPRCTWHVICYNQISNIHTYWNFYMYSPLLGSSLGRWSAMSSTITISSLRSHFQKSILFHPQRRINMTTKTIFFAPLLNITQNHLCYCAVHHLIYIPAIFFNTCYLLCIEVWPVICTHHNLRQINYIVIYNHHNQLGRLALSVFVIG